VGYDNEDVYRRLLGFTRDDFARLREMGVTHEEEEEE
jgi:hypothetical protein